MFREFGTPLADDLFLSIEGYFDAEELNIFPAESPVSAPLELYRYNPEHAQGSVRGSGELKPSHPLGFGGAPNGILVHMDLARELRGEDYIDSVRVRVAGVEDMNERSQVRIAAVAEQIREATGLHVDVVLGSSNMAVDVELQKYDNSQRQEYRQQVVETMNELIPELEAATGHTVVWDFGAFPFDMDQVLVNVPTLAEDGDKIYRQAQAILESGL
ncbi:MAG: hypothetical protein FH749_15780 [Firmicutes bacterium]|nr:hypothetical protein [Bacillota bacterium]